MLKVKFVFNLTLVSWFQDKKIRKKLDYSPIYYFAVILKSMHGYQPNGICYKDMKQLRTENFRSAPSETNKKLSKYLEKV
jgi:hypothetical protein